MLLKICLLGCLAMLAAAAEDALSSSQAGGVGEQSPLLAPFETSHKHPEAAYSDEGFHTAHKISVRATDAADYSMNLLPTKERPELNPVLSALINEDVMKSIEAKRAIEIEELEAVRREIEEAERLAYISSSSNTEAPEPVLTTTLPIVGKTVDLSDNINVGFVDQTINLDEAGTENSKKSRIEIKKGPNGQDYEYEYVYYYEDEDADSKAKPAIAAPAAVEAPADLTSDTRGKTRYTNIERSTPATPSENSLHSGKAKGRASSVADGSDDIEAERLPTNTRFPSRGKNIEVQPTPALDSLENAAERKKISVKRPSLELVDSQTFNTDEKQAKGTRNGDSELKPAIAIEQEQAAAAAAAAAAKSTAAAVEEQKDMTARSDADEAEQTTPSMEKAALDLYAILTNENLNNEQTTAIAGEEATTMMPDTDSTDADETGLTTQQLEELSSTTTSTTTTTTTTTTTEAPSTTTTSTAAPSLFGGRRGGLNSLAGRNRFKLREGGHAASSSSSTTTTTEAPSEPTKTGRNRFSRPLIGQRPRLGARTTTTASPEAAAAPAEEEVVAAKEVKPVSTGFARSRPRNRFNLRGSTTTTEKPAEEGAAEGAAAPEEGVSSTTARTLRGRPGLGLRGRSRTTTTKAPAAEAGEDSNANSEEHKATPSTAAPAAHSESVRPTRFNLHRAGSNRLLPRGKLGRAGVTTEAPKEPEDSAADSSHHNDVKGEAGEPAAAAEAAEKTEGDAAAGSAAPHAGPVSSLNRLKNRPRLNALHKTDAAKPKPAAVGAAPAPTTSSVVAPRKINPLLAKRRLHLGLAASATSTTEAPAEEESSSAAAPAEQPAKEEAPAAAAAGSEGEAGDSDAAAKEQETTEASETTTKQARGLGLLGQRRRLPLRKPGTIL